MTMKLATFRSGGQDKIGLVHGNDSRLFDLAAAADRNGKSNPAFASMLALIDAGPAALDQANAQFEDSGNDKTLSVAVASVEILAPIPEPRQMRDGMSFPLHILQAPRGQLKLAARAKNDMAELKRIEAEARVNGKMRSQGVTDGMLFSFEEIIAHVTKDETLMPGEFIGSGTVGNGCGLELGWYLEHGDTIELDVEKIGVLKNRVERQDA